jgi:hypothetical protein
MILSIMSSFRYDGVKRLLSESSDVPIVSADPKKPRGELVATLGSVEGAVTYQTVPTCGSAISPNYNSQHTYTRDDQRNHEGFGYAQRSEQMGRHGRNHINKGIASPHALTTVRQLCGNPCEIVWSDLRNVGDAELAITDACVWIRNVRAPQLGNPRSLFAGQGHWTTVVS